MSVLRKPFRREGEDVRRGELVSATLACIATLGMERTTVREIAIKAGVTPGLIRHYFVSKDELVLAAYLEYIQSMSIRSRSAVDLAPNDAISRLTMFVIANLSAPTVDQTSLSLWAGFVEAIRHNSQMAAAHRDGYLSFRSDAEQLITDAFMQQSIRVTSLQIRKYGIALNAIIDGLWLEGSLSPEEFVNGEIAQIGIDTVSAVMGFQLALKKEF